MEMLRQKELFSEGGEDNKKVEQIQTDGSCMTDSSCHQEMVSDVVLGADNVQDNSPDSAKPRLMYSRDFLLMIGSQNNYKTFKPTEHGFPSLDKDTVNNQPVKIPPALSHMNIMIPPPPSSVKTTSTKKKKKKCKAAPISNEQEKATPQSIAKKLHEQIMNPVHLSSMQMQSHIQTAQLRNKGPMMPPALSHMRSVMGPMQWGGGIMIPPPPARVQPKVQLPLRREEVKLHRAENAWKPSALKRGLPSEPANDEEHIISESIVKKTRGILNMLTPDNFDKMMAKLLELPLQDSVDRISTVVGMVYEKAILSYECSFLALYARLIYVICTAPRETSKIFKKQILNLCQFEFQTGIRDEIKDIEVKIKKAADKQSHQQLLEKKMDLKKRWFCNMRLIGELYKLQILTPKIMVECVDSLIRAPDEESLECLCKLLTSVGQKLDVELKSLEDLAQCGNKSNFIPELKWMDITFKQLETLLLPSQLSMRIKLAILDVIELRDNGWKPASSSNVHKTMEQQDEEREPVLKPPLAKNNGNKGGDGDHGENGKIFLKLKSSCLPLQDENSCTSSDKGKEVVGESLEELRNLQDTEALLEKFRLHGKVGDIENVTSVVFKNAIASQKPSVYAKMVDSVYKSGQACSKKFKSQIVEKCSAEFNRKSVIRKKGNKNVPPEEIRKWKIGTVRFIVELYKLHILSPQAIVNSAFSLIKVQNEDNFEYLYELLVPTGEELEKEKTTSKIMKQLFSRLSELSKIKTLPPSIHSAILNVVELRKNNWKPKRDQADSNKSTTPDCSQSQKQGELRVVQTNEISKRQTGEKRAKKRPVVIGKTGYPAYCWRE